MSDLMNDLNTFFIGCRNRALEDLSSDLEYVTQNRGNKVLLNQLESELELKQKNLLNEYIENSLVITSKQINYCCICIIRDILKIKEYFNDENWNQIVDVVVK